MATTKISVPFAVDLTRETAWNKSRNALHRYWIVRTHFNLRERQADDTIKVGNKLAAVEAPRGVSHEVVTAIKTELTSVQFRETFQEAMRSDESLEVFATTLAGELESGGIGRISSELKSSAQRRLAESFRDSYRIQNAVTRRVEETYELKYTVDPKITDRLIAAAAYQRYAYDIYLTWVDYLSVEYRRALMGLRKKRTKRPAVKSRNHSNWEKFNVPLATALFWKPLPKSSLILLEKQYNNEVKDSEDIEVRPPEDSRRYVAERPDVPTLYQISNVAFPLKWIHRQGPWTEDDLKRVEDEEARDSAWYWNWGPGRKTEP